MIKILELKKQWIKDPEFRKEYEELESQFERARQSILSEVEHDKN